MVKLHHNLILSAVQEDTILSHSETQQPFTVLSCGFSHLRLNLKLNWKVDFPGGLSPSSL